ncbi:MAG: ribonuclease D [Alphaproteobacteria bacterium]|jgi:ribonuclease D|nr:ribonuclease D [Alphaproteobacteria bacterium]
MTVLYSNDLPDGVKFKDSVAIDTETLGLNIHRDRLCLVQLADKDGNCYMVQFDGNDYSAPNLKALLKDNSVQKIFHYGRFDVAVLKFNLGVMTKNLFCTKIASKLCRTYTDRHSLKVVVQELLNIELDKEKQSSDWSSEYLSEEQLKYAANDVLYLHKVRDKLVEKLERVNRLHFAEACFKFLPTQAELDLEGFEELNIFNHH